MKFYSVFNVVFNTLVSCMVAFMVNVPIMSPASVITLDFQQSPSVTWYDNNRDGTYSQNTALNGTSQLSDGYSRDVSEHLDHHGFFWGNPYNHDFLADMWSESGSSYLGNGNYPGVCTHNAYTVNDSFSVDVYSNSGNPELWSGNSGFGISRNTDMLTSGSTNSTSVHATNNEDGNIFLSGFYSAWDYNNALTDEERCYNAPTLRFSDAVTVSSLQVANGTYAYLNITEGDGYQGKTWNDENDSFTLTVYGLNADGSRREDLTADFTLGNGTDILNEWDTWNLDGFSDIYGLQFTLDSTDVHPEYGINTPMYFMMDNLTFSTLDPPEPGPDPKPSGVPEPTSWILLVLGMIGLARGMFLRRF